MTAYSEPSKSKMTLWSTFTAFATILLIAPIMSSLVRYIVNSLVMAMVTTIRLPVSATDMESSGVMLSRQEKVYAIGKWIIAQMVDSGIYPVNLEKG